MMIQHKIYKINNNKMIMKMKLLLKLKNKEYQRVN